MIDLYSQGMGSAAEEAEKSANNITGSLNRLHNTWVDTVENVADSDAIITIVNGLNGLLSVVNNVTDKLDSAETLGALSGLLMSIKGIGKHVQSFISVANCTVPTPLRLYNNAI